MMESPDLDQQHQFHQRLLGSSSSVDVPSFHLVGTNNLWSQNLVLTDENFNQNIDEVLPCSRDNQINHSHGLLPNTETSVIPDLGPYWICNTENYTFHSGQQPDLSVFEIDSSTSTQFSGGGSNFNTHNPMSVGGTKTTNISSSNFETSSLPSPYSTLGMGFSLDNLALFREGLPFEIDHLQRHGLGLSSTTHHQNLSSSPNGATTESKRHSSICEQSQTAPKKPRFESSCTSPFKQVRKEKLGDRIQALQQLVAPFGKTDTASVLKEAIGYIKFLHGQVQTLSVPYMRSTINSKSNASLLHGDLNGERDESKLDLRSRGLCLVPVSCTSYIASELNRGI
ncbi:Transcription factor [Acorus gramineus]|uniref:Transcription factor n=1 Tax=Acorus gramineus TaxID=55184 RepID=A0AAV9AZD4_ACOGR|nr:Transcription factor [Acorus gramineus]